MSVQDTLALEGAWMRKTTIRFMERYKQLSSLPVPQTPTPNPAPVFPVGFPQAHGPPGRPPSSSAYPSTLSSTTHHVPPIAVQTGGIRPGHVPHEASPLSPHEVPAALNTASQGVVLPQPFVVPKALTPTPSPLLPAAPVSGAYAPPNVYTPRAPAVAPINPSIPVTSVQGPPNAYASSTPPPMPSVTPPQTPHAPPVLEYLIDKVDASIDTTTWEALFCQYEGTKVVTLTKLGMILVKTSAPEHQKDLEAGSIMCAGRCFEVRPSTNVNIFAVLSKKGANPSKALEDALGPDATVSEHAPSIFTIELPPLKANRFLAQEVIEAKGNSFDLFRSADERYAEGLSPIPSDFLAVLREALNIQNKAAFVAVEDIKLPSVVRKFAITNPEALAKIDDLISKEANVEIANSPVYFAKEYRTRVLLTLPYHVDPQEYKRDPRTTKKFSSLLFPASGQVVAVCKSSNFIAAMNESMFRVD
jgi:hypothetical protein